MTSSCGSAEDPLLPPQVLTAAPLPQELLRAREEGAPFPESRPQEGRLHGHCSEDEVLLVYIATHTRSERSYMVAIISEQKS